MIYDDHGRYPSSQLIPQHLPSCRPLQYITQIPYWAASLSVRSFGVAAPCSLCWEVGPWRGTYRCGGVITSCLNPHTVGMGRGSGGGTGSKSMRSKKVCSLRHLAMGYGLILIIIIKFDYLMRFNTYIWNVMFPAPYLQYDSLMQ